MRCGTHDVELYGSDGGQADKYVGLDEIEKRGFFLSCWVPWSV